MKAAALVPVEEYLRTAYRPDCDYVDGEGLERNVGEQDHGDLQGELVHYFRSRRREWRVYAYPEQRVQVAADRFRVPDVCVVRAPKPKNAIFRDPPFLSIQVLAKNDTPESLHARIYTYL